jgi:hypothetical protein
MLGRGSPLRLLAPTLTRITCWSPHYTWRSPHRESAAFLPRFMSASSDTDHKAFGEHAVPWYHLVNAFKLWLGRSWNA